MQRKSHGNPTLQCQGGGGGVVKNLYLTAFTEVIIIISGYLPIFEDQFKTFFKTF